MLIHDENGRLVSVKNLSDRPRCAVQMEIKAKGVSAILVATDDKKISVFRDQELVEEFETREKVSYLVF